MSRRAGVLDRIAETDLYAPVKAFLEAQGYVAKGEVRGCDIVATRDGEPPVIVELKRTFGLALVLQGVNRLTLTDRVYLAVQRPRRPLHRDVRRLCRRLGLGLMTVVPGRAGSGVEVLIDPAPYRPRVDARRLGRLLREHARRAGDPNRGGMTRAPLMTVYRQEALRCVLLMQPEGAATLRGLRATGLVPNAARILQRDVYGWFERTGRASYRLTARAGQDLRRFAAAGTLPDLTAPC